jgi:ABC-type polysaccharide/polyol phosphate transport system ATPase subunit
MLPRGTIEASNIWKRFRADQRGMLLRDELGRMAGRIRGKSVKGWRWALRGVSLDVPAGESLGLVGPNGSGKSSLLKILSKVMDPHSGSLQVSGRIGALIQVRAGLHSELSGRENIALSGSLLGLPRRAVQSRFDEIVAFAEIEDAIDRQLKFYSVGMQMRLGFSVAAFLEPDILLIDEILAVGDASFQQKCLNRMRAVLDQGTTLVFVSHDLAAVEATCTKGLWLHDGVTQEWGPIGEVLTAYRGFIEETAGSFADMNGVVRLLKIATIGHGAFQTDGPVEIDLTLRSEAPRAGVLFLGVSDGPPTPAFILRRDLSLGAGDTRVQCRIESLPLPRGRYFLWVAVFAADRELLPWHPAAHIDVVGPDLDPTPRGIARLAPIHVASSWEIGSLNVQTPDES